jgi:uncharacterized repeat protein (TIGR01451 family)
MKTRTFLAAMLVLSGMVNLASAQAPPPLPGHAPAPLLFVRFAGPPGLHATFFQGQPTGRDFPAPVVVGMRPGYVYRVKLSGLPDYPSAALYPTLEVRGSLHLPPKSNPAAYPVPVILTAADVANVLAGGFITKVIYLENPDNAVPISTTGELPEIDLPPSAHLLAEARERGRPLLIVRLGERTASAEELACSSVPGTILFPGEKSLTPPRAAPCLPWACFPLQTTEECFHDGGDRGQRAGIGPDGRLHGLDPEDTVAEYTDSAGRRSIVCSNRVCLCVPRYGVLRNELLPSGINTVVAPGDVRLSKTHELVVTSVPSLQGERRERLTAFQGRLRPSATTGALVLDRLDKVQVLLANEILLGPAELLGTAEVARLTSEQRTRLKRQVEFARQLTSGLGLAQESQVVTTSVIGRVEGGPEVVKGSVETRDLTVCCNEEPRPPDRPLVLCKWVDKTSGQVGDVVTFYLRYSNQGGRPITDVALSDSLSPRLEYVPGSARADRDAVFTTQANEAGSVILRWEISGRLLPGQKGVVSFQARIR